MGKIGNKILSYRIVLHNKKNEVITLTLKNKKEEKIITCGSGTQFYRKDRLIRAKVLKIKNEISIYNYDKKTLETFEIINKTKVIQDDKYKVGDITTRIFDVNDKRIKNLNLKNWR